MKIRMKKVRPGKMCNSKCSVHCPRAGVLFLIKSNISGIDQTDEKMRQNESCLYGIMTRIADQWIRVIDYETSNNEL